MNVLIAFLLCAGVIVVNIILNERAFEECVLTGLKASIRIDEYIREGMSKDDISKKILDDILRNNL